LAEGNCEVVGSMLGKSVGVTLGNSVGDMLGKKEGAFVIQSG
jgi:hypothetical protein